MIEINNDEVLILGLTNSGKSTLVNVLTSKKVSIIDAKTVELENIKTSAEMLYHAGGIHIQKTQA